MAHHTTYPGGTEKTLYYSIDENPWYVKAGSILPLAQEGVQDLQHTSDALRLLVVPGSGDAQYSLYEDDETTQSYTDSGCAFTLIEKKIKGDRLTIIVHPRKGSYNGASSSRNITLVLEGWNKAPLRTTINGNTVNPAVVTNAHDVKITLPAISANATTTIVVEAAH